MFDSERVRAVGNWAFLKVLPRKGEVNGIVLPESNEDKVGYCRALVLSVGPGKWDHKIGRYQKDESIKPGIIVYVRKYLTEVNPATLIGSSEFCFLDLQDLLAEVDEDSDIVVRRI